MIIIKLINHKTQKILKIKKHKQNNYYGKRIVSFVFKFDILCQLTELWSWQFKVKDITVSVWQIAIISQYIFKTLFFIFFYSYNVCFIAYTYS